MPRLSESAPRVVITGAGLAGAATAYALTERGARDVVLLEREALPGTHSSGRNAAMIRQVVSDARIAPFAAEGATFVRRLAAGGAFAFRQTGSLFLAEGQRWERLQEEVRAANALGVESGTVSHQEALRLAPFLAGSPFEGAAFTPSDGVVDVANLLAFLLREAARRGARLLTGRTVTGFEVDGGRLRAVRAGEERFEADAAVNAAGAWAGEVAALAEGEDLALTPCRRHLVATGPLAWVDANGLIVWDLTRDVYFRPESGGLLLSPCDEEPAPPGIPPADPRALELLAKKIEVSFPGLAELPVARSWAGLRTVKRGGGFAVGRDARLPWLFHVAGLGGHGVTCSAAAGARAAGAILEG